MQSFLFSNPLFINCINTFSTFSKQYKIMKQFVTKLLLCAGIFSSPAVMAGNYWQQVPAEKAPRHLQVVHPTSFKVYVMDEASLKMQMFNLSTDPDEGMMLTIPMPDGSFRDFIVWQSPMMEDRLAAKYPDIKTFSGRAVGNQTVTAKLEFTPYGFSAMIYDGDNTSFVDPFDNYHDGYYMVHYKKDEVRAPADRMRCEVKGEDKDVPGVEKMELADAPLPAMAQKTFNGHNLRTYRLALSANHFYCQAATGLASPTIAQCLAKMTISMNRVNGLYNRDFSVQMNFCNNEDTLIWPTNTGSINGNDPFNASNTNGSACLGINQTQVTNRIGAANYDCGHVFTTGGGGISSLGVVCSNGQKAQSVTGSPMPVGDGFDIDYVAHEMGHEFGSNHTFNNNANGSCSGNAVSSRAYEPGSGATIMDYAGICSPDDLQPHSDAYFSASSLVQIQGKLATTENVCAVITSTGNKLVYLDAFAKTYTIPYKTPFELLGPTAVDSVADTAITYGWCQWNLGDFGSTFASTRLKGPIFRSFNPAYTPLRIFPKNSMVLSGTLSAMGEKAPDTTRYLTFKMVVRNIMNGKGCFLFPDDTIHLNAVSTGAGNGYEGFKVTSQSTVGLSLTGASTQTITWNVVGTSAAPVSCAKVNIYMSTDGGNTWAYNLGQFPNNGSANVTVPNPPSTIVTCRFKVKGDGNVFFNVNGKNFSVTNDPNSPVTTSVKHTVSLADKINIYPVPASNVLNISANVTTVAAMVYSSVGQNVWNGNIEGAAVIPVATWARGVYYVRFTDAHGNMAVKSFILE
jgi:hypothetical protein